VSAVLQHLLDRQAISEVLYLYCRACDRADEVLLRGCFHPDSTHRHGGFEGLSADFCGFTMKIIGRAKVTKHVLTNVSIEIDGDRAWSEAHYSAYHRTVRREDGTEEDNFSGGRYLDRFERREGRWRIAARIGLIDYERFQAPTDRGLAALPPAARSRRLNDDALYEVLGLERSRRLP
jgi:SnoaL-like domain